MNSSTTSSFLFLVKYVDDADLAYILLRYRESHDFYHTIYNLPPTVLGEIILKYTELLELKLGAAGWQAFVGTFVFLSKKQKERLAREYLPWVLENFGRRRRAQNSLSLIDIFWEDELHTDIDELRGRLGIVPFAGVKKKKKKKKK